MEALKDISTRPRTLEEFLEWEPNDGLKYEWNDGELIQFIGMNKAQFHIYTFLNRLFIAKGYWTKGTFVAEQDVQLSGIQMRRPDMAFFSVEQENNMKNGKDEIPEFVIEVISGSDNFYKVEEKISEYFKAGVKVVWNIIPDEQIVQVYTSRKTIKICTDDDICSAAPVLAEFEITAREIFA
jgi:Uma2 family endonuclease